MTIAKRHSRLLEHEGVRYRWRVRRHGSLGLVVWVAAEDPPGRRIGAWYSEIYDASFTPADVHSLIDEARRRGWSPRGPGPDEYLIRSRRHWVDAEPGASPGVAFEYAYARAALGLAPSPDLRQLVLVASTSKEANRAGTAAMPIERCADQLDAARQALAAGGRATLDAGPGTPTIWLEPVGQDIGYGVDHGACQAILPRAGVMESLRDLARRLRTIARRAQAKAGDKVP